MSEAKTISRAATRRIAELRGRLDVCKIHTQDGDFAGASIDPSAAWDALAKWSHARLIDRGDGTYMVHVHSNCWYVLAPRVLAITRERAIELVTATTVYASLRLDAADMLDMLAKADSGAHIAVLGGTITYDDDTSTYQLES